MRCSCDETFPHAVIQVLMTVSNDAPFPRAFLLVVALPRTCETDLPTTEPRTEPRMEEGEGEEIVNRSGPRSRHPGSGCAGSPEPAGIILREIPTRDTHHPVPFPR